MWNNYLFFETPDNYLVSLDARTGKERWHVEIADFDQQYFSTMAPIVVGNHVLVGTGNDLDAPGFLQSYDPETGKRKWIFYTVPMKPGDPGLDTWPSLDAARHGGGQVWIPGVYDPGDEAVHLRHRQSDARLHRRRPQGRQPLHLLARRGERRHRQDGVVLPDVAARHARLGFGADADPDRRRRSTASRASSSRPRRATATSSRVDRVTGEHIVTSKYGTTTNWAQGHAAETGAPSRIPSKEATIPGSLVSPVEGGVTNWPPPAYSPDTGLFYVHEHNGFNMLYLTDPDPRGSMGLGGKPSRQRRLGSADFLTAIDYKTGKAAWRHAVSAGGGGGGGHADHGRAACCSRGDGSGNFVAFDATNGKPLWHSRIGNISNAPQTYLVDGTQHVLVAVGDTLYAFAMY